MIIKFEYFILKNTIYQYNPLFYIYLNIKLLRRPEIAELSMDLQSDYSCLNILCIGQMGVGKSSFLHKITGDNPDEQIYRIYVKKYDESIVYFHELSEYQQLYLQTQFDALLFFVDLKSNWMTEGHILRWLELYSRNSGKNIFKIPLSVIVMNSGPNCKHKKWRNSLEEELASIITLDQIIYFDKQKSQQQMGIKRLIRRVSEQKLPGIKCTTYSYWKLFGVRQFASSCLNSSKIAVFRCWQYYTNLRGKIKSFTIRIQ